jgi:ELWxxDGT repeat protein
VVATVGRRLSVRRLLGVILGVGLVGGSLLGSTVPAWADDGPNANPAQFTRLGTEMFFSADDGAGGRLWKTDGTTEGTDPVADVAPFQLMRAGTTLYFTTGGSVGDSSTELWKSDDTTDGTTPVKTIPRDPDAPFGVVNLSAMGSELFFSSSDPAGGADLWKSDGSPGGTVKVKHFAGPSSSVSRAIPLAGNVYFAADDGTHGVELWKSDGNTTSMIENLNPGNGDGVQAIMFGTETTMIRWHSKIFFSGNDGADGFELWKTDGTPQGTHQVDDINPGPESSNPNQLARFGSLLLFAATDDTHGNELWRSDGSRPGTALVKDIAKNGNSRVQSIVKVGERALFISGSSRVLRRTNGTAAGTKTVRAPDDGGPLGIADAGGGGLVRVQGIGVLFEAQGGPGTGLWKSNGWRGGTGIVKAFSPGPLGELPTFITAFGTSRGIFSADDGVHGQEPWITDGTPGGTELLKDINQ